jgi:hypothetical protein
MGEIKGKTGPAEDAGKFGLWSDKWEEDRTVYCPQLKCESSSKKMVPVPTYVVKVLSEKGALDHVDKKVYPIFFIA